MKLRRNSLVFLCSRILLSFALLLTCGSIMSFAQETAANKDQKKPVASPTPKNAAANITAEQVVESSILVYAFPGGRVTLNQIRKTAFERGRVAVTNNEGRSDSATYQRWTVRPDGAGKEKIRLDQQYPSTRYSLILNADKVFGIFNDSVFTPREDASNAFQNQIFHSIDSLLRYKENESTIALGGREKVMGVEFYLLDMTDKQNRKTRYFISVKSFRVMMLEYEFEGAKYRRRFYDYKYAQGTLFPFRSVLSSGDKVLEEVDIGTITFGQKIDEGLFPAG